MKSFNTTARRLLNKALVLQFDRDVSHVGHALFHKTQRMSLLHERRVRQILVPCLVAAWLLLGIGFLSPLTPSEGVPPVKDWIIYGGIPLGCSIFATIIAPNSKQRMACAFMLALMVWFLVRHAMHLHRTNEILRNAKDGPANQAVGWAS